MAPAEFVRIHRTYAAPPAAVFAALTRPELIVRWWSPSAAIPLTVKDWDLRVGGRWRFAYQLEGGTVSVVTGTFTDITPHARLAFTWTWEPPDRHAGVETLVSITLEPARGGTALTVTHERFPDADTRQRHELGWGGTLDRLAEILA